MPSVPCSPSSKLDGLVASSNAFALDLFTAIRAQQGNVAISPLSICAALAMTWAGARGETAAQMKSALHLDGAREQVLDAAGQLVAILGAPGESVTLRVASRLFGDAAYHFEPMFLDATRAAFGAGLDALDFRHAADKSRVRINAWVAKTTDGCIRDLLPRGSVNADTRLVLANALYFLGEWRTPFAVVKTGPARFYRSRSHAEDVPTMNQTATFLYAAMDGIKLLQMPYRGGELAMALVLPDETDGLDALEQRLSSTAIADWLGALQQESVIVALPKFKIDPPGSLQLREVLRVLGMSLAFDRDRADFTGLAKPPAPEDRLYIDEVFHKAFVKLDERGTEAAAATGIRMARRAAARPGERPKPREFRADHPFLFFLRHVPSGLILFMGRVTDPGQ